jgi:hypothetical protein
MHAAKGKSLLSGAIKSGGNQRSAAACRSLSPNPLGERVPGRAGEGAARSLSGVFLESCSLQALPAWRGRVARHGQERASFYAARSAGNFPVENHDNPPRHPLAGCKPSPAPDGAPSPPKSWGRGNGRRPRFAWKVIDLTSSTFNRTRPITRICIRFRRTRPRQQGH